FGAGVSNASLAGFVDAAEQTSATVTTGQTNFGVTGTLSQFNYTFASPKDSSIGIETTNPTVSSTDPVDGATNVALNATVTSNFSEAMDQSTITTSTFTVSAGGSDIGGSVSTTNNTGTFTPSSNLSNGVTYTATLSTGIKDLAGNALSGTCTWSFSTGGSVDTTAPTVFSTNPSNGDTGVAVDSSVSATFSESVDSTTVNTNTFTLTHAGGSVSGTVSLSDKTATFIPSSDLTFDTEYTGTITTGVKDTAGNPIATNFTWVFTTDKDSDGDGVGDNIDSSPNDNTTASPNSSRGTGKILADVSLNPGKTLSRVRTISDSDPSINQTGKPSGFEFKDGLVQFTVNNVTPGASVNMKLTFPSEPGNGSKCFKVDTNGFQEIDCNIAGATVTYTITDGGEGDSDGTANGSIDDPFGVASPTSTTVSGGSHGGCFISEVIF
ncbi:MAG: Ig-like domain-containing protein, partial [Pseudomonadota bacterium]